jgi:hypothetical protein
LLADVNRDVFRSRPQSSKQRRSDTPTPPRVIQARDTPITISVLDDPSRLAILEPFISQITSLGGSMNKLLEKFRTSPTSPLLQGPAS